MIQAEDEIRREITEAVQGTERGEDEAKIQIAMKGKAWKRKKVIPLPDKKELLRKKYGNGNVLGIEDETESSSDDMDEDEEAEEKQENSASEPETDVNCPAQMSETEREPRLQPKEENLVKSTAPVSLTSFRTTVHIPVTRSPEIQAMREKLPIVAEEQVIMEAINENPVVILEGETGSGKTTQVPQFLYEAGYATGGKIIGVTEPRRVAAMAMSKRVGEEMGDESLSSYQVRFEGNVTAETKIKFMTDGVLLREMAKDFRLKKYSAVVIDEAHERSVFTDILLGFLSRVVRMRQKDEENGPLKLVVMSATLRAEDFTQNTALFKTPPPKISVEGRQFETVCKFEKKTPDDYVAAAIKKTAEIHAKEPQGGILVFLTGQQEVNQVVRKLRTMFPSRRQTNDGGGEEETIESVLKLAVARAKKRAPKNLSKMGLSLTPEVDLDRYRAVPLDDTETDAMRSLEEDEDLAAEEEGGEGASDGLAKSVAGSQPMWTLPLYSLLNSERQRRVFEPVPEGHRLCVVATNIAETSLTIPGIKYVVDCGKVNTKFYDRLTGVSTFRVTWISKAAADQRKGRAGRQGPGRCYRLYSSAVFEDKFSEHTPPEICKRPVDDLVLQMKAMNIINVINFPFPTPPDPAQLRVAEQRLLFLGALTEIKEMKNGKEIKTHHITDLGKSMSRFPVAPCFSKMIALSGQHGLMPYTIAMVAALSVQEVLMETPVGDHADAFDKEEVTRIRKIWAGKGNTFFLGDPGLLLKAVCAAERDAAASTSRGGSLDNFCNKYALRRKAMVEIRKLRQQLTNEVNLVLPHLGLSVDPLLEPPSDRPDRPQAKLLRQIIASGMSNQVAKKVDVEEEIADPKERKNYKLAYRVSGMEDPVFLHSRTVFALKQKTEPLPEWIAYQEIFETDKLYVRGASAIEPGWLPQFAPAQCHLQPPLSDPEPWYEEGRVMCRMNGTFGKSSFILPVMTLPHPEDADGMSIRYFARFLLEGIVLPELSSFTNDLNANLPAMFTRTVSFHSERVKSFYGRLVSGGNIDRVDRLRAAFKKDKDFLKPEFKLWVSQDRHEEVNEVWPSLFSNVQ